MPSLLHTRSYICIHIIHPHAQRENLSERQIRVLIDTIETNTHAHTSSSASSALTPSNAAGDGSTNGDVDVDVDVNGVDNCLLAVYHRNSTLQTQDTRKEGEDGDVVMDARGLKAKEGKNGKSKKKGKKEKKDKVRTPLLSSNMSVMMMDDDDDGDDDAFGDDYE